MPTFLFSGAIFPLNNLPEFLKFIAQFNPLSYGIDGLRWALISNSHFGGIFDLFVLFGVSTFFVGIATYIFLFFWRRLFLMFIFNLVLRPISFS